MPHYCIYRVEPDRGDGAKKAEYPLGYVRAKNADAARDKIDQLGEFFMAVRVRGSERIIAVQIGSEEAVRQAKAVKRERERTIMDCREVLERISFSVD